MSIKALRWLFTALLVTLLILPHLYDVGPITIGASAHWTNERYRFAGGTTPGAIAVALLTIALYLVLMWSEPPSIGQPLPGVFRRFVAFWCDFMLAMVSVAPILGILPTLIEWKRTGIFAWNFVRTTYKAGDTLEAVVGFLCAAGLLVLYFALPLVRRRPSPGSCILGYQVLPRKGSTMSLRRATFRVLLGFVAVSGWFILPLDRDRKNGQFWLDKVFETQAIRLS